MKKLLPAMFVALLMVGCGEEEIEPHTEYYENGQKRVEGTLKGGTPVDLWTRWHENGQKQREETYKDGKYVRD